MKSRKIQFLTIILLGLIVGISAISCNRSEKKGEGGKGIPEIQGKKYDAGGKGIPGFKALKWGMSQDQVVNAIGNQGKFIKWKTSQGDT
ncbi:MAG: hypothetical protein IID17_14495 [Nitrospinae bacterium]|nr:hypothetical protein [Nitrospinota bacterium]